LKILQHRKHIHECFYSKKRIEQKSLKEEKKELKNLWGEWQIQYLSKWMQRLERKNQK